MVEGPGCTRNGQKAKAAIGKRVVGSAGHVHAVASAVRGCTLTDVLTLGKQCWLMFTSDAGGHRALRCHFGMVGSLLIDSQPSHQKKLALLLKFDSGTELRMYEATVNSCDPETARAACAAAQSRDVCGPAFDARCAVQALTASPADRMVADALLDQAVLPGVGNIIKNEALHRAAIDPRRHVHTLAAAQLQQLVAEVRAFAMAWLRGGRHPACRVYNRTACADCGGAVTLCKLGEVGAPRPTFWCRHCCGGAEPSGAAASQQTAAAAGSNARAADNPWTKAAAAAAATHAAPTAPAGRASGLAKNVEPTAPPLLPRTPLAAAGGENAQAPTTTRRPAPCRVHGPAQVCLRRVRKPGANLGRLFFSCRSRGCEHFVWADGAFPPCACPRPSGLRISKKAHSGGRWFFSCRQAGCSFFQWAPPDQAQLLGGLLTPLT